MVETPIDGDAYQVPKFSTLFKYPDHPPPPVEHSIKELRVSYRSTSTLSDQPKKITRQRELNLKWRRDWSYCYCAVLELLLLRARCQNNRRGFLNCCSKNVLKQMLIKKNRKPAFAAYLVLIFCMLARRLNEHFARFLLTNSLQTFQLAKAKLHIICCNLLGWENSMHLP